MLVFRSSPHRDGNSRRVGYALVEGYQAAGHASKPVHLPDRVEGFLRDCLTCRGAAGLVPPKKGRGSRKLANGPDEVLRNFNCLR
jgi:hypothetical protein